MAPLSSGEDVAEEAEADLLQRLGEAGKGEAAPDARPGKVGEAELDLRGGGLWDEGFVQGGRDDCLEAVGPHKIKFKDWEKGFCKVIIAGRDFQHGVKL